MKTLQLMYLAATVLIAFALPALYADESIAEKVEVSGNDAKRGVKKAIHRVDEALCTKGEINCGAKKLKNRVIEAKDATVDKADEVKNKLSN